MMPYQAWHNHRPDISHLKAIGIPTYVYIPKEKRVKLDFKSHEGRLVRYGGTNQYRVWDPVRNPSQSWKCVFLIHYLSAYIVSSVFFDTPGEF